MSSLKFLIALVAAVVAAVAPLLSVGPLGFAGEVNVLVVAAGAVYVYLTTNHAAGAWAYAKTYAHAIAAVGVVLVSALSGGITPVEWLQIGVAVAGTLGVLSAPNKSSFGLAA